MAEKASILQIEGLPGGVWISKKANRTEQDASYVLWTGV